MNPDGTNQVQLITSEGSDYVPDWSPEERKLHSHLLVTE